MNAPIEFRAAMAAAGLDFSGEIIPDGQLHRVKVDGDRGPNSWYVLHPDGIAAGSFGCWKRGLSENWCAKTNDTLTEAERADRDRKWEEQRAARIADQRRLNDAARASAQTILDKASPADDEHPYLQRKGVKAYPGVKIGAWPQRRMDGCLLIPARAMDGRLATVEAIFPEKPTDGRDKDFLKGGAKTGAFFTIGDLASATTILIAEGYATAATLHEATGYPAVVAFDAGNLAPVTTAIRSTYLKTQIVLCADNDRATPGNPGLSKARRIVDGYNTVAVRLAVPKFTEDERGSDFNDLAALHGLTAVKDAVEAAIRGKRLSTDAPPPPADDAQPTPRPMAATNFDGAAEVDPVADEVPDWPTSGEEITDAVADVRKVKAPRNEKLPPQNVMARKLATESFENRLRMDPITGHWLEYQPDAGIFRPRPSGAIEREVYLEISKREGAFPASYISSVVRLLAYEATAEVEPVIGKIPFKNGVLDLQTRELLPHSPDYGFTEAIPYPWNHDAPDPTPVIDWLREAVGGHGDQVQLLRAFLHAVVVGRPDLQRYLELVGPGGTGKGTFTRLATALVGNKLTHSTTLTQLENNRFETAALFGKKLATITDAEKWHGDVSVMKSITGQDALRYEQKHIQAGEPFTFGGMVIVSANQHMESTDYSSGIQRRRITVRFDHMVQPAQKRDLDSEFAPYLPAVMKWVLDMPAHEVTAYLRMTSAHVGSLKQVRLETLAQTNPIAAWLMEAVEFGPGLAAQVGTKKAKRMTDSNGIGKTESWDVYENQDIWLYPNFCRWCDEHGKRPIACNAFGNQLIDVARNMLGHPVVRGDKRRDGSKVVGLRIKPGDAQTAFGDEPVMNRDEPVTYQPIDGDELFKLRQYSDDKSLGARQSAISTSVEAMNRVDCGKVCAEGGESDEVHHLYHNQGLSSSQSITGSSQSITGSSPPGASGDGKTASPTARILARLHGVPAGVTDEELKRAICNGKGLSPALVDLALIQLVKDGEISRLNGRWVESRA